MHLLFRQLFVRFRGLVAHRWGLLALLFFAVFAYATTGYMYFELAQKPDLQWVDAMWWTIVTMTTVGYGDYFPESFGGRLYVGVPTMLMGVSVLGYILSAFASILIENRLAQARGMSKIDSSDHIIVCHWHGPGAANKLVNEIRSDASTRNARIVIIDEILEELPPELAGRNVSYVRGDPSRSSVLERANLEEARFVLVLTDARDPEHSDQANLAVALSVAHLNPSVYVIVHCLDPERRVHFERAGCNSVVCTEALASQMLVQEMQDPGIHEVFSELSTNLEGKQCYIVPLAPERAGPYRQLRDYCQAKDILLLGIDREGKPHLDPSGAFTVSGKDRAIVIADDRPRL